MPACSARLFHSFWPCRLASSLAGDGADDRCARHKRPFPRLQSAWGPCIDGKPPTLRLATWCGSNIFSIVLFHTLCISIFSLELHRWCGKKEHSQLIRQGGTDHDRCMFSLARLGVGRSTSFSMAVFFFFFFFFFLRAAGVFTVLLILFSHSAKPSSPRTNTRLRSNPLPPGALGRSVARF